MQQCQKTFHNPPGVNLTLLSKVDKYITFAYYGYMEPQVIVSSPNRFKLPIIIASGIITLLVLNFLAINYLNKRSIDRENLAVPYSLLRNPMVYEWRGSVEGTLIAKTKDSIILKKNNATMTIPINTESNGTKFFYQFGSTDKNNAS